MCSEVWLLENASSTEKLILIKLSTIHFSLQGMTTKGRWACTQVMGMALLLILCLVYLGIKVSVYSALFFFFPPSIHASSLPL